MAEEIPAHCRAIANALHSRAAFKDESRRVLIVGENDVHNFTKLFPTKNKAGRLFVSSLLGAQQSIRENEVHTVVMLHKTPENQITTERLALSAVDSAEKTHRMLRIPDNTGVIHVFYSEGKNPNVHVVDHPVGKRKLTVQELIGWFHMGTPIEFKKN